MNKKTKLKQSVAVLCILSYSSIYCGIEVQALELNKVEKNLEDNIIYEGNAEARYDFPRIKNAYFDKQTAKVGDTVTFWVELTDESMDYDRVEIDLECDRTPFGYSDIILDYDINEKKHKASIKITDEMPSGRWTAGVMVRKNSSGYGSACLGNLDVSGTSAVINDYVPEIKEVKISKSTLKIDETFDVEVKLDTKLSDIKLINFDYQNSIGTSNGSGGTLYYDSTSNSFKGYCKVNSWCKPGTEKVYQILAYNTQGESFSLNISEELKEQTKIAILDETVARPEIVSITPDKSTYESGDIATFKVKMKNHRNSDLKLNLKYSAFYNTITSNDSKYLGKDEYEIKMLIPYNIKTGDYKFEMLEMHEVKTGHFIGHHTIGNFPTIKIYGEGEVEKNAPTFVDISINKEVVKPGENLKITLDAEENESYISYALVKYKHEKIGKEIAQVLSFNRATGKYEADFSIDHSSKNGKWNLSYIELRDINGNRKIVDKDLPTYANFEIVGSDNIVNNATPVIKSVKSDKALYKTGETVKLIADVDVNGASPFIMYATVSGKYAPIVFSYNNETKKYEGTYMINDVSCSSYDINIIAKYGYSYKQLTYKTSIKTSNEFIKNTVPTITASNKKTKIGDNFDILSGIKAADKEDGDISNRVSVLKSNLDLNKTGTYQVTYLVTDSYGAIATKTINVVVENGVYIKELTTDTESNAYVNTKIKVISNALGENLNYEFFVKPVNGEWTRLSNYSKNNFAYWTPTKGGEYVLRVRAKYDGSSNKYDDYKDIKFNVRENLKINTFTTDKASGTSANEKITLKATANVTKDIYYEFYVKEKNDSKWTKLKGMGPRAYVEWTPTEIGEYTLRVRAKYLDSDKTYEAYKDIKYVVNSDFKITEFKASNSAIKTGEEIKVTSKGNYSNGRYEFFVKKDNGDWTKIKMSGRDEFATYKPSTPGAYTFMVRGKHVDSTQKYDSYKTVKVNVYEPIKINALTTNKPSGSKVGTKITITAGPLVEDNHYEFYVKESNDSKWTKLKGLGPKNYAYWTPDKAGKYTIRVRAKNVNSTANYDSYKDISFTVGS